MSITLRPSSCDRRKVTPQQEPVQDDDGRLRMHPPVGTVAGRTARTLTDLADHVGTEQQHRDALVRRDAETYKRVHALSPQVRPEFSLPRVGTTADTPAPKAVHSLTATASQHLHWHDLDRYKRAAAW
ncbi:hypothetical protein GCM10010339_88680 [Streptomyces alanosinicus]|uniref:Uncharacterized protein n=1 Tax=Streptomyces alanosinicus TaxID=68171 RepID=A0A918YTB2_9ACTN|nr:hypothetical protein GCM10010339_88680 [Streptomyces alanosinicus]